MELRNKKILLVSPEPWDHIFVSKHHYAVHLGQQGNQVVFLGPPESKWVIRRTSFQNVSVVSYPGFMKGLRFLPSILRNWRVRKVYNKIQEIAGMQFDLIWSFDNSVFFDFHALPKSVLKISHIVDLNQDFQTRRAASSADICFGVTREIVKRLKGYNDRSHFINHGLSTIVQNEFDPKLPGNNSTKAMYMGNLAMKHLDWKPLYRVAKNAKDIDFIFVGPNSSEFSASINVTHRYKEKLARLNNSYFIPAIASEEVPVYLKHASILLICYQDQYHNDQANSHKILEYLYSGNPIVASFTREYDGMNLLNMSNRNSEWQDVFYEVKSNLKKYSGREQMRFRISFAMDHTYQKQIGRIERIILGL